MILNLIKLIIKLIGIEEMVSHLRDENQCREEDHDVPEFEGVEGRGTSYISKLQCQEHPQTDDAHDHQFCQPIEPWVRWC